MKSIQIFIFCICMTLFAAPLQAQQQEPSGGEPYASDAFAGTLNSTSDKTPDGFYYKAIPLPYDAGGRLYLYYSAKGKSYQDLSIVFYNEGGAIVRYHSGVVLGSKSGIIELDTVFTVSGNTNILLSTENPEEELDYTAAITYASAKALEFQPQANLCWKICYLLKNSDNGFRFIKTGKAGGFGLNTYATTAPLLAENPLTSSITAGMVSTSYNCLLGRGTQEEAQAYFSKLVEGLKQCLGTYFEYSDKTDANGLPVLSCKTTAATSGQLIHNLAYSGNNAQEVKYVITLSIEKQLVQGNDVYDVKVKVENDFWQY